MKLFSPFKDISVWIDHGFQPYNFSLFKKNEINPEVYEKNLKEKGISILWNYIDSGTSTAGVINQMNPDQFTVAAFFLEGRMVLVL